MAIEAARRLFTVEEFHRMGQAGILSEDDRVELVDGEIVEMSPIGSRHAACVDRLNALFTRRLGKNAIVRVQNPIVLGRRTEFQPDLALLKPRPDFYAERHPRPADVFLVVEVIETSGEYDRSTKLPRYARSEVPEVWLVDLQAGVVEVYRHPALRGYGEPECYGEGRRISLRAFERTWFRSREILGL